MFNELEASIQIRKLWCILSYTIPTIWFRAWKATLHMSDEMLLMHNKPRQSLHLEKCCCFGLLLVCGSLMDHLRVLMCFCVCVSEHPENRQRFHCAAARTTT